MPAENARAQEIICRAIREHSILEFDYRGLRRVVEPYCHGTSASGESLRAIQIGGSSRSGGYRFGKLWTISEMTNLVITDRTFVPDDPDYNPNDSAFIRVHCRV